MDSFGEQLIKKQTTPSDIAKRIGIMLGSVALCAVLLILSALAGVGIVTGITLSVIVIIGSVWLLGNTSIEYEYIVTNEDIDIDKIMGRRQRKRLITLKLPTAEDFGVYDGTQGEGADATVIATDATGINAYYLIARHKTHGKTIVIFTPDERIRSLITEKLPPKVRNSIKLSASGKGTTAEE